MKLPDSLRDRKGQQLLLLVFLLLHTALASVHISRQDITSDEPHYFSYAANWARGRVERTDKMFDSKTPVVAVALAPRVVHQWMDPGYRASDNGTADLVQGRYMMVLFTLVIALYLYSWIGLLFGPGAWVLPLLFFLFDPLVLGYSMIVTSDMASGACLVATFYHLYRFYRERRMAHFLAFSAWLGTGLVCKPSFLFLLPVLAAACIFLVARGIVRFRFKKLLTYAAITTAVSLAILNLAYYGRDSFLALEQIPVKSQLFQSIAALPLAGHFPLPVPATYSQSLDLLQYHQEIGGGRPESSYPGVFLNGITRYHGGFWYYYLFQGLYKIPLALLLLIITGIVSFLFALKRNLVSGRHLWYVLPAAWYFIVLSVFNSFQLGLRHLLLIYPLLFIGLAGVLVYWQRRWRFARPFSWVLLGWMIVSVSIYFPTLLPYMNELAPDKKNVFRKIRDGSIDYGQSHSEVARYIKSHPGVEVPGAVAKPGKFIVPVMHLLEPPPGIKTSQPLWLLRFEPVAHDRYSLLIFDVPAGKGAGH